MLWGEKTLLLKPQTYMNLSGESAAEAVAYYKLDIKDMLVVADDVTMEFGKIRLRTEGSAGGHNGFKSVIRHFGEGFARLKIGIGNNPVFPLENWVLSLFTAEELAQLEKTVFPQAENMLEKWLAESGKQGTSV